MSMRIFTCCALMIYLCGIFAVAAGGAPELMAEGEDLVLSVSGQGQIKMRSSSVTDPQAVASMEDIAQLEQLTKDLLAEQKDEFVAAQKVMFDTMSATIGTLQTALSASNVERDALQAQVNTLQGVVEVNADGIETGAVCQQALVDAVHSGAADVMEGCPDSTHVGGCEPYPELKQGEAVGHGERKGAVRFIMCNEGYKLSGAVSRVVVCGSDGEWSDRKLARCDASTTATTTTATSTTTTTIADPWILVFRQRVCKYPNNMGDGADVGDNEQSDCFGRWSEIEKNKGAGPYMLKLKYPGAGEKHEIIFTQTASPFDADTGAALGFQKISQGEDKNNAVWTHGHRGPAFAGLYRYKDPSVAYLAAGSGHWYSLGYPSNTCFPGNMYAHDIHAHRCNSGGSWTTDWVELYVKRKE